MARENGCGQLSADNRWGVKGVLSVSVICFVVLLPFFAFREVSRIVGRREMWGVFFQRRGNDPRLAALGRP